MILENLRDRRPDLFPMRGPTITHAEAKRQVTTAEEASRRRRPTRGQHKLRMWAARFGEYQRAMRLLMLRPKVFAEMAALKDREAQLAQTGGIEATK
jgi:hypothetical protein